VLPFCFSGCLEPPAPPAAPAEPAAARSSQPLDSERLVVFRNAGRSLLSRSVWEMAAEEAEAGLRLLETSPTNRPELEADLWEILGQARLEQLRYAEARAAFSRQLLLLPALRQDSNEVGATCLQRLAVAFSREGKLSEAKEPLTRALVIRRALNSPPSVVGDTLVELANVAWRTGDDREAQRLISEAMAMTHPGGEADDKVIFRAQVMLAESLASRGDPSGALTPYAVAAAAAGRHETTLSADEITALMRIATTQSQLTRVQDQVETLKRAIAVAERTNDLSLVDVVVALAVAYRHGGSPEQAEALYQRYQVIKRRLHVLERRLEDDAEEPAVEHLSASALAPGRSRTPEHEVANAAIIVGSMRPGFRTCYEGGLRKAPGLRGAVRLLIHVESSGAVETVSAHAIGIPLDVVDCILEQAGVRQFDAPVGGSTKILLPVRLVPQP